MSDGRRNADQAQATLDRVQAVANEEWGWNRAVALQRALHDALSNPDSEWGKASRADLEDRRDYAS